MTRREDWPERLADYIDAHRDTPFLWGVHDCSTFAAGAIESMTGSRPDVPTVKTATDYARLLAQRGPLVRIVTDALGEPIHPGHAQRGDVVLIALNDRDVLGVCVGASAVAPSEDGLLSTPVESALHAWRV